MSTSSITPIKTNDGIPLAAAPNMPTGVWSYIPTVRDCIIWRTGAGLVNRVLGAFQRSAGEEAAARPAMSKCGLKIAPQRQNAVCGICLDGFSSEDYREDTTKLKKQAVTCLTGTHEGFHWKCIQSWLAEHSRCFYCHAPFYEGNANPAFSWARVLTPISKSAGLAALMTFATGVVAAWLIEVTKFTGLMDFAPDRRLAFLSSVSWGSVSNIDDMSDFWSMKVVRIGILIDAILSCGRSISAGKPQLGPIVMAAIAVMAISKMRPLWDRVFNHLQLPEFHRIHIRDGLLGGVLVPALIPVLIDGLPETIADFAKMAPETVLGIVMVLASVFTTVFALRQYFENL